jgi:hypothetical protein
MRKGRHRKDREPAPYVLQDVLFLPYLLPTSLPPYLPSPFPPPSTGGFASPASLLLNASVPCEAKLVASPKESPRKVEGGVPMPSPQTCCAYFLSRIFHIS